MRCVANHLILLLLGVLALCACSKEEGYKVEGTLAGGETTTLTVSWPQGQGIHEEKVEVRKGKFEMKGTLPAAVLMTFNTSDGKLLGHLYIEPDTRLKVTFDLKDPLKVKVEDSDINQRWAKFLSDNSRALSSGDHEAVNAAVEGYVNSHRGDVVSTLLLLTRYDSSLDPEGAAALMSSINAEARPAWLTQGYDLLAMRAARYDSQVRVLPFSYVARCDTDTFGIFSPHKARRSLIVFSDMRSGRRDSIVPRLRELRRDNAANRLAILDLSMDKDTTAWAAVVERDSATWAQGWVPGSVTARAVDRLSVSRLPYFIVADSLGRQLYRGPSVSAAIQAVEKH